MATKTTFNLPEEDLAELRRLAERQNVTMTQALRQAIKDSSFITKQVESDNTVLIQTPDGTVRELLIYR